LITEKPLPNPGAQGTLKRPGEKAFGAARPHHAYIFANRRANRMKILMHDGLGDWLAARRLNQG